MNALDYLVVQKNQAFRVYDKRIKAKSFCIGDLVWKAILPIGDKSPLYGSGLLIRKVLLLLNKS